MGWLPVLCAVVAALLFRGMGHNAQFMMALVIAFISFWSYGVMHNFAYDAAMRRQQEQIRAMELAGNDRDEIEMGMRLPIQVIDNDAQQAPNWATYIAMVSAMGAFTLLILALINLYGSFGELMRTYRSEQQPGSTTFPMPWWLNWPLLLIGIAIVFVAWSWAPTHRLDSNSRFNNPVGRPLLNTLVLTGIPLFYARLTNTPLPWLLIPLCFILTHYAVMTGRFLEKDKIVASRVMLLATATLWIAFWIL